MIGLFLRDKIIQPLTAIGMLMAGVLLFVFYPVTGDRIHLVTDMPRMAMTTSCFLICIGFYKINFRLPGIVNRGLKMLGEASYSVYLLHPIVHRLTGFLIAYISQHFIHLPERVRFIAAVIFTLVGSYFVYQYFEKFFIRLGKKVSTRNANTVKI